MIRPHKTVKRLASLVMGAAMALGITAGSGIAAYAQEAQNAKNTFDGGAGTESRPYLISTPEQLDAVRDYNSKYFKLTKDIDVFDWEPIESFIGGGLDGDGYTLSYLQTEGGRYGGLFGSTRRVSVLNLGIENASIQGEDAAGGVMGKAVGGSIKNCYVTGKVNSSGPSGGLVGDADKTVVSGCYAMVTSDSSKAGGIAGTGGKLSGCYYSSDMLDSAVGDSKDTTGAMSTSQMKTLTFASILDANRLDSLKEWTAGDDGKPVMKTPPPTATPVEDVKEPETSNEEATPVSNRRISTFDIDDDIIAAKDELNLQKQQYEDGNAVTVDDAAGTIKDINDAYIYEGDDTTALWIANLNKVKTDVVDNKNYKGKYKLVKTEKVNIYDWTKIVAALAQAKTATLIGIVENTQFLDWVRTNNITKDPLDPNNPPDPPEAVTSIDDLNEDQKALWHKEAARLLTEYIKNPTRSETYQKEITVIPQNNSGGEITYNGPTIGLKEYSDDDSPFAGSFDANDFTIKVANPDNLEQGKFLFIVEQENRDKIIGAKDNSIQVLKNGSYMPQSPWVLVNLKKLTFLIDEPVAGMAFNSQPVAAKVDGNNKAAGYKMEKFDPWQMKMIDTTTNEVYWSDDLGAISEKPGNEQIFRIGFQVVHEPYDYYDFFFDNNVQMAYESKWEGSDSRVDQTPSLTNITIVADTNNQTAKVQMTFLPTDAITIDGSQNPNRTITAIYGVSGTPDISVHVYKRNSSIPLVGFSAYDMDKAPFTKINVGDISPQTETYSTMVVTGKTAHTATQGTYPFYLRSTANAVQDQPIRIHGTREPATFTLQVNGLDTLEKKVTIKTINSTSMTVQWQAMQDSGWKYTVYYSTEDISSPDFDPTTVQASRLPTVTDKTTAEITNLRPLTKYYVNVVAEKTTVKTSYSGDSKTTNTDSAYDAPVIKTDPEDTSGLKNGTTVYVTMSAESGATIYYTLDGKTPTKDSTKYSGEIKIKNSKSTGETIKISAIAIGGTNSERPESTVSTAEIVYKTSSLLPLDNKVIDIYDTTWAELNDALEATQTGTVRIMLDSRTTTISKSTLAAIKGKKMTVIFDMGDYFWTVNGEDVKTARESVDLGLYYANNFNTLPATYLSSFKDYIDIYQMELDHDGPLPFDAKLTLYLGRGNSGKFGNLYYANESKKKSMFMESTAIKKDGSCEFTFSHASKYAIVITDTAMTNVSTGAAVYDGDMMMRNLPIVPICAGALGFGVLCFIVIQLIVRRD